MKRGVSFVREPRNHKIMICLTKSEYEQISGMAFKNGLSNSSYCRQVLISVISRKVGSKND